MIMRSHLLSRSGSGVGACGRPAVVGLDSGAYAARFKEPRNPGVTRLVAAWKDDRSMLRAGSAVSPLPACPCNISDSRLSKTASSLGRQPIASDCSRDGVAARQSVLSDAHASDSVVLFRWRPQRRSSEAVRCSRMGVCMASWKATAHRPRAPPLSPSSFGEPEKRVKPPRPVCRRTRGIRHGSTPFQWIRQSDSGSFEF